MIAFWAVTALVIAADLITKQLVVSGMELNSTITVIPGVFDLTYIINRGAAWGVLADKQMLLNVFTVIVIAALVFYAVRKHKSIGRLELVSIAMIIFTTGVTVWLDATLFVLLIVPVGFTVST